MLVAMGQDATLARMAGGYCLRLIPGLPPHYAFLVLNKHLQSQGILAPSVWVGAAANVTNAFLYRTVITDTVQDLVLSFKALVLVKPFDEFFCKANDVPVVGHLFGP